MSDQDTIALQYLVKFRSGTDYKHVHDDSGDIPVIGSGGPFTTANEYLYDGESVLFGRKGTIDRPIHIKGKFWTVDTMFYTELGDLVNGRWLYYWAKTIPFELYSTDTALPSMTSSVLGRLKAPVRSLETQQAIADYLDHETGRIDTMIAKLDKLVETLVDRRIQLVRGETLLMPDGKSWPLAPIGYLFRSIGSGTTPRGEKHYTSAGKGVPWVTTSELRENTIFSTSKNVTKEAVSQVSGLTVHPTGSVLIAMYGATIGRLGILGVEATTNQACCVFSGPEKVDSKFFYYTLLGQRDDIIQEGQGGGQPNINQGLLRRWKI